MLYLDNKHIREMGIDWNYTISVIEEAVKTLFNDDYSQPIKPYLKFKNVKNRIIAMPAYVGGEIDLSGIKWVASFPDNITKSIPRAHSVTILNDSNTGKPLSILNTARVSGIRTASVSGLILKKYLELYDKEDFEIGIIGFGPIGQLHLEMIDSLLGSKIKKVKIFDQRLIDNKKILNYPYVEICESWEEVYRDSDIFVTCTVSSKGYIDLQPKNPSLLLNVSLRDFTSKIFDYTSSIVVDNWEEVNRENTDIARMHIEKGLQEKDTASIVDVVCLNALKNFPKNQAIMFNPMGMAVFDIAIAAYYYDIALKNNIGIRLEG